MSTKSGNPADIKGKIGKWRDGADGFFAFLNDVKPMIPSDKGGYEPYEIPSEVIREEIRRALDGSYSTIVFSWPRRHGKTVVAALIIVWRFLTRRTQVMAIVANSERQTVDTAFQLVRNILEQTPYTKSLIGSGRIKVQVSSLFYEALGNVIQGFPASTPSLYGKKLSVAQISELHAARSDTVFQTLASSTIDTADGLTLVDSTVGSRTSPLYGLYQIAQRDGDPAMYYSHLEYRDLEDAIERGPRWIKPERLRSRAAQMLPMEFAQQHLNQWTAASSALFPEAVIDKCRGSYLLNVKDVAGSAAHVVGAGLDRAFGFSMHGDATVSTCVLKVLDGEEEHYYVLASDSIRFSSASGIKKAFLRYHTQHGMSRSALESYNAQDIAAWCSEQSFDHELVSATLERQANAFTALYNAASEGRLHIHPAFDTLLAEMGTFEYRLEAAGSKGSLPRFEHARGAHDDHVYSLAWAVYSLRDVELNPYEVTGIHCDAQSAVAQLCLLNGGDHEPPCSDLCRSFQSVRGLYDDYARKASVSPLGISDFVRVKMVNTGSHSIRR